MSSFTSWSRYQHWTNWQTWLNPVLDLVIVLSFKKWWVHHSPDLFPQSKHELQAAEKDADTGNDQDRSDLTSFQLVFAMFDLNLLMMNNPTNLYSALNSRHTTSDARPAPVNRTERKARKPMMCWRNVQVKWDYFYQGLPCQLFSSGERWELSCPSSWVEPPPESWAPSP